MNLPKSDGGDCKVANLREGVPVPSDGWLMDVPECFEKAREAPGYTTFELALVSLAHHYADLLEEADRG